MNPTFAYVYDSFLAERKHERDLAHLETELARLGVEGKVIRLSMFRQVRELIADALRLGVRNLVFVGNDRTFQSGIPLITSSDITVGFIPFEKSGVIAQALGIPTGVLAAEVLAARRIELFDLGTCDGRPFLVDAVVPIPGSSLEVEGRYRVGSDTAHLEIRNLIGSRADDGELDAHFVPAELSGLFAKWRERVLGKETHLLFKQGTLTCPPGSSLILDGEAVSGSSFSFGVLPRALKCIVGKTRQG